jgi:hypothetical protein
MGCAGFLRQVPARYAEYEIGRRRQVRRGGRPPLLSVRSPLRLPSVLSLRVASRPDRKPKIAMRFQHPSDAPYCMCRSRLSKCRKMVGIALRRRVSTGSCHSLPNWSARQECAVPGEAASRTCPCMLRDHDVERPLRPRDQVASLIWAQREFGSGCTVRAPTSRIPCAAARQLSICRCVIQVLMPAVAVSG